MFPQEILDRSKRTTLDLPHIIKVILQTEYIETEVHRSISGDTLIGGKRF